MPVRDLSGHMAWNSRETSRGWGYACVRQEVGCDSQGRQWGKERQQEGEEGERLFWGNIYILTERSQQRREDLSEKQARDHRSALS